jgi:hypothetical protein
VLRPVREGAQRLRIRGDAHASQGVAGQPVIEIRANGTRVARQMLERVGLFILEADLPQAAEYELEIAASPTWTDPQDDRVFTVNLSMIRLVTPD